MNPHWVGGAGKWCGAPLYRGALHRCTNPATKQKISSHPVLKGWEEDGGVPVVPMDSKSKQMPVHRPPMFTGKNKHKPAGPSGILNHGQLEKENNDK